MYLEINITNYWFQKSLHTQILEYYCFSKTLVLTKEILLEITVYL